MLCACFCGETFEFEGWSTCPACGLPVREPPRAEEDAAAFADRMAAMFAADEEIRGLPEVSDGDR